MKLDGSCHCGAVSYSVTSRTPYPFNRCHCSKCRKTGGSGFTVNIMADAETLKLEGSENITVYRSASNHRGAYEADGLGYSRKHFCRVCGSPLYIFNPEYPQWIYPCATSVDTELPAPPAVTNLMLGYKPSWVAVSDGPEDKHFEFYPDEGIEDWHRRRGLFED